MKRHLAGLIERCLAIDTPPPVPSRKTPARRQEGLHFHLGTIFDRINRDYFEGAVTADVTWGRRPARRLRRSIRLRSYRREENLIRISPVLDAPFVPSLVIEALVHHEMLHAVIPVRTGPEGRRVVHGDDFRTLERRFHGCREAEEWIDGNIGLLLGRQTPPAGKGLLDPTGKVVFNRSVNPSFEPMEKEVAVAAQFEIYKNKKGEFRWRLRAKNKQIVASGQAYKTKAGCKKGIEAVKKSAAVATLLEE